MKTSPIDGVLNLYQKSADSYSKMMDSEIKLPIYADTLDRLAKRIANIEGPLIDTSCGSGHMLELYHQRFDPLRPLIGIDISSRMVEIAREKLGKYATLFVSDMRDLSEIRYDSISAVISFFAIHHLIPNDLKLAFQEWHRVLSKNGQLVIGAWEGSGLIDYGDESDLIAQKYSRIELTNWISKSGFAVNRCNIEFVEDMEMNAIYIESTKDKRT